MANEHLYAALHAAGIDADDLAVAVRVDTKTVERWLAGRTPHPRHRRTVARALNRPEHQLWPELTPNPTEDDGDEHGRRPNHPTVRLGDLLGAYPSSSHPDALDALTVLAAAEQRIDLLDETLIHLLSRPDITDLLSDQAGGGCQIRILIAHPDSTWMTSQDVLPTDWAPATSRADQQPDLPYWKDPQTLKRLESERAHGYLTPLLEHPGITAREYLAPRFNTIIRADDQMLTTLHLFQQPQSDAPLLHLKRRTHDDLFDRFASHYDTLWNHARITLQPDPATYPHPMNDPDRYLPLRP